MGKGSLAKIAAALAIISVYIYLFGIMGSIDSLETNISEELGKAEEETKAVMNEIPEATKTATSITTSSPETERMVYTYSTEINVLNGKKPSLADYTATEALMVITENIAAAAPATTTPADFVMNEDDFDYTTTKKITATTTTTTTAATTKATTTTTKAATTTTKQVVENTTTTATPVEIEDDEIDLVDEEEITTTQSWRTTEEWIPEEDWMTPGEKTTTTAAEEEVTTTATTAETAATTTTTTTAVTTTTTTTTTAEAVTTTTTTTTTTTIVTTDPPSWGREETTTTTATENTYTGETFTVNAGGKIVTDDAATIVAKAVMAEVGDSFNEEAIKAQAIAAYTYIKYYNQNKQNAYVVFKTPSDKVTRCVNEVIGKGIYYDGKLIQSVYSASSAGYTASSLNVWGVDYPYLRSVNTDFDALYDINYGKKATFTSEEIKKLVESNAGITLSGSPDTWFSITSKIDGNYVGTMTIGGQDTYHTGSSIKKITGRAFRENIMEYKIRSSSFDIAYNAEDDTFVITTYGYGHGVGMSQHGANILATKQGYSYEDILKFYYQGTEIK